MPQNGAALWIYVDKESLFEISSPQLSEFARNVHNGLALCEWPMEVVRDLVSAKPPQSAKQRKTDKSRWGDIMAQSRSNGGFLFSQRYIFLLKKLTLFADEQQ